MKKENPSSFLPVMLALVALAACFAAALLGLVGCTPPVSGDAAFGIKVISTNTVYAPAVAASGDKVYAFYYDSTAGAFVVRKSGDRGVTWTTPLTVYALTAASGSGIECALAVNGSRLYLLSSFNGSLVLAQVSDLGGSLALLATYSLSAADVGNCSPSIVAMDEGFAYACYDSSSTIDGSVPASGYLFYGNSDVWTKDPSTGVYTDYSSLSYPETWTSGAMAYRAVSLFSNAGEDSTSLLEVKNDDSQLRFASYSAGALGSGVPAALDIGEGGTAVYVTGANYPSIGYADAGSRYLCYIGRSSASTDRTLTFFSHFTYTAADSSVVIVNKAIVADPSASCTYCRMACLDGKALIAYYDSMTKGLMVARGAMDPSSHEYSFSRTTMDTLGGGSGDGICSIAVSGPTVYIAYVDSAVGGLKLIRSTDGGLGW